VAIKKADQDQTAEVKAEAKGEADEKQLQAETSPLAADDAVVERLEESEPAPAPAPPRTPAQDPQSVGPAVVVVADPKDQLIDAMKKDLADTKVALNTAIQEAADYKQANQDSQAECVQLRAALAVRKVWAAGGLYGTDSTAGAFVERDFSAVRVGIDVVRRPIAGGQTTVEAIARVGIRF
jgi:hypothetical protein